MNKADISINYIILGNYYELKPLTDLGKEFLYLWNRKVYKKTTILGAVNEICECALKEQLIIEHVI